MGNSAAIQCLDLSSLVGIAVQWFDMDEVNISNTNTLMISNVIPSLHNTVYTCRAVVDTNPENCVSENKTIIINVKGMLLRVHTCPIIFVYFRYICCISSNSSSIIVY